MTRQTRSAPVSNQSSRDDRSYRADSIEENDDEDEDGSDNRCASSSDGYPLPDLVRAFMSLDEGESEALRRERKMRPEEAVDDGLDFMPEVEGESKVGTEGVQKSERFEFTINIHPTVRYVPNPEVDHLKKILKN